MSNSILLDRYGPDWPLGFISVATPGTPVGFMSVVDPSNLAAPGTATAAGVPEYTFRAQQIVLIGFKPSGGTWIANTGNAYVVRKGSGSSNRADSGALVTVVQPGQVIFLAAAPLVMNVWNPYRYSVDADNAGDGLAITLLSF